MVKTIVPGAPSVPLARSQSGPSARMWGTLWSLTFVAAVMVAGALVTLLGRETRGAKLT
jgi:hypothetical protein